MTGMTDVGDQGRSTADAKTGSVVFGRLRPTNRITEIITFLFYPAFFSVVGTMWLAGLAGQVLGVVVGVILAVVAVRFRRWGARWAVAHTEKREKQAAADALDEAGEIAPQVNVLHLAELFYISMEVGVLGVIAAYSTNTLHAGYESAFVAFYNAYAFLFDFIFSHYGGLDQEIEQHMGTPYQHRIFFIKASASLILCAGLYGLVLGSARMCVGWRRYVLYVRRVRNQINMKKESRALGGGLFLGFVFIAAVYGVFYGGNEFFVILNRPPEANWFMYIKIYEYIVFICGFVMFFFPSLAFFFSFFVLLFVHRFTDSKSERA